MAEIISAILILASGLVPSLIWLIFFLKEDEHPEPRKLLIRIFKWGAISSLPVLAAQLAVQKIFISFDVSNFFLVIAFALIEEAAKFLAVYWIINKNPEFDEPIDAVIYMITAAMGFAAMENLFIISNYINAAGIVEFGEIAKTLSLRFVGATLLHALSSGILGYFWAKARIKKEASRALAKGFFFAVLIHAIFNFLVLRFQDQGLLFYPTLFLVFAALFILKDFEKLKVLK